MPDPSYLRIDRRGFTLIELLLVVAILAVLIGLLLPAVQKVRERANALSCQSKLGQMGLALSQYGEAHRYLPAGYRSKVEGQMETGPGWGWASEILPWMEQDPLSGSIDFSVSPLDAKNRQCLKQKLSIFRCPGDPLGETLEIQLPMAVGQQPRDGEPPEGPYAEMLEVVPVTYVGFCGTTPVDQPGNGLLYRNSKVAKRDIEDGESHTLIVCERGSWVGASLWQGMLPGVEPPQPKTKPPGYGYLGGPKAEPSLDEIVVQAHPAAFTLSRVEKALIARPQPLDGLGSYHTAGTQAVFADGHVQAFTDKTRVEILKALVTRSGGEVATSE